MLRVQFLFDKDSNLIKALVIKLKLNFQLEMIHSSKSSINHNFMNVFFCQLNNRHVIESKNILANVYQNKEVTFRTRVFFPMALAELIYFPRFRCERAASISIYLKLIRSVLFSFLLNS